MFSTIDAHRERLRVRYAEPHRAYHNQTHIDAMLAGLAAVRPVLKWPDAVELAIWFHDAIYDPAASDNEARSATLLLEEMGGLADPAMLAGAALLIRLTASHALPPDLPPDWSADAAVFLDLDMAVLGADAASYDAYERGIAAEYVPVFGAARYGAGRRHFLEELLLRPRLFHTDEAHRRLDEAARRNIQRALAATG